MTKAIVLISGGIDSAVALYWAIGRGWSAVPLSVSYHARPEAERAAVKAILRRAGVKGLIEIPMDFLMEVEDLSRVRGLPANLRSAPSEYIPARNMIFYAVAAYYAETLDADVILGGHNQGDPEKFPDSSSRFFKRVENLLRTGLLSYKDSPVRIVLPLRNKTKNQVVRLGFKLAVPFDLTWSCHGDGEAPCGKCSSCIDRAAAFRAVGMRDPRPPNRRKGIYRGGSS